MWECGGGCSPHWMIQPGTFYHSNERLLHTCMYISVFYMLHACSHVYIYIYMCMIHICMFVCMCACWHGTVVYLYCRGAALPGSIALACTLVLRGRGWQHLVRCTVSGLYLIKGKHGTLRLHTMTWYHGWLVVSRVYLSLCVDPL